MDKQIYYDALAGKLVFEKITEEELLKIVNYKPGKSFSDVNEAVKSGKLENTGPYAYNIPYIAGKLTEIVELDTTKPWREVIFGVKD